MEILRWTGRPGMALINRIGDGDHVQDWRNALSQYFRVIREFDAHQAGFEQRIQLLRTFAEVRDEWRQVLAVAVDALEVDRRRRCAQAVGLITDLLIESVGFSLSATLKPNEQPAERRNRLETRFHDGLREREATARRAVERLYGHTIHRWQSDLLSAPAADDLFSEDTWRVLGLTPRMLLMVSAGSGAAAGLAADASVGGLSGGTGALVGGVSGLVLGAYQLGKRFAQAAAAGGWLRNLGRGLTGATGLSIGPHPNPNLPWVLLDRALLHLLSVSARAHARQDHPRVGDDAESPSKQLDNATRKEMSRLFTRCRRRRGDVDTRTQKRLYGCIGEVVDHSPNLHL